MSADVTTLGIGVDSSGVRKASDDLDKMAKEAEQAAKYASFLEKSSKAAADALIGKAKAASEAAGATEKMATSMQKANKEGELLGLKIAALVTGLGYATYKFIELGQAVGDYVDIATKTGGDPAGLASLRTAADLAHTSVESIAQGMVRLTAMLNQSGTRNSRAEEALKNLNINIKEFKALSADEQYRKLATAFDQFENSTTKSANAIALWGRGGAEQLVLMNKMIEAGPPIVRYTNAQIEAIDHYTSQVAKNRSELKQLLQATSAEMVPAFAAFQTAIRDVAAEMLGLNTQTGMLDQSKSVVREFAWDSAEAIGTALSAIERMIAGFQAAGLAIAVVVGRADIAIERQALNRKRMWEVGLFGTTKEIDEIDARLKRAEAALNDTVGMDLGKAMAKMLGDIETSGQKIKKNIQDQRAAMVAMATDPELKRFGQSARDTLIGFKPTMKGVGAEGDGNKERERAEKAYASLIQRMREYQDGMDEELSSREKLTKADRDAIAAKAVIDKLTGAEQQSAIIEIDAMTKKSRAKEEEVRKLREAQKLNAEILREQQRDRERAAQFEDRAQARVEQEIQGLNRKAEALREETEIVGMSSSALEDLRVKRMLDQAALIESAASIDIVLGKEDEFTRVLLRQAQALRGVAQSQSALNAERRRQERDPSRGVQNAIDKYIEEADKMGIAMEKSTTKIFGSIEDGLTELFTKGKTDTQAFINMMIAEFYRLQIVKPLLTGLMGGGWGGGIFGLLAGGASGSSLGSGGGDALSTADILNPRGQSAMREGAQSMPRDEITINDNRTFIVGDVATKADVAKIAAAGDMQTKSEILRSRSRGGAFAA